MISFVGRAERNESRQPAQEPGDSRHPRFAPEMQQFGPRPAFLEKVRPEQVSSFVGGAISSTNTVRKVDVCSADYVGPTSVSFADKF